MEASRLQGQECGSNLFHSWKIPRRGQGFWSRVHGSQGQKPPPNCLPLRKGGLIRQQWPFSRNLWGPTGGSGCLQVACLTWVLHRSGGEGVVVFAVLPPWEGVLHLPIFPLPGGCVLAQSSQGLSRHTADARDTWPGRHQVSQYMRGEHLTEEKPECREGRQKWWENHRVWSIYTQTTTLETLLWAWQHSSKPPACVTLIACRKGVLITRTRTETFF